MCCCCSVVSYSLQLHGLQHARLPCPFLSPGVCSNSCPLSRWWHPTISSSIALFSSCPAFNLSQHQDLFQWVSSSFQLARVLELQLQHQSFQGIFRLISFRIDCFDLFAVPGTLRSLLQHHDLNASLLWHSAFVMVQFSHQYMTTGKNHSFDYMELCRQSDVSGF